MIQMTETQLLRLIVKEVSMCNDRAKSIGFDKCIGCRNITDKGCKMILAIKEYMNDNLDGVEEWLA